MSGGIFKRSFYEILTYTIHMDVIGDHMSILFCEHVYELKIAVSYLIVHIGKDLFYQPI